ncbi:MAG: hypothetical protein Q9218_006834 [Villophora microphyllina]
MNAFFNSWYTGLTTAVEIADLVVNPIITTIDQVNKNTDITDIPSVLIAGLPFLGAPIGVAAIASNAIAQTIVTGLQQAPGLVKAFWPDEVVNSQIIQMGEIQGNLKTIS